MAVDSEFHVPDLQVTDGLLERVQFSVSSRNAEAKICETVAHVFGSPMVVSPRAIGWSYITTGMVAILRNKELVKKKYVWTLNLCIYNIQHGVLVWKGKIPLDCNYTDVSDNFHVLALEESTGILGIIFQEETIAKTFYATISQWIIEGLKDDKGKPLQEPTAKIKFRKEMISKPCNFQHVQGSQAIEECIEIERIKGHILASLARFKLNDASDSGSFSSKGRSSSRSKKREPPKPKLPFKEIEAPATTVDRADTPSNGQHFSDGSPMVESSSSETYRFQPTPPLSHTQLVVEQQQVVDASMAAAGTGGSDRSQSSSHLGRLSPLDLEEELTFSFTASTIMYSNDNTNTTSTTS